MPELPEVETVRRGIAPILEGKRIRQAITRREGLRYPFPEDFSKRLEGNRIEALRRRSKYILIECEDGLVAILHLGMSGRITIHKAGEEVKIGKHDHVSLITEAEDHIVFADPRRFGILVFTDLDSMHEHPLLKSIGPEPLGNAFNEDHLNQKLEGRRSPIKTTLLDQKVVAGLGNIYVCEALWRAGISPRRTAASVKGKRGERLVPIVRDVLMEAIEAGGSTLKDYAQVDGELGYFQHRFNVYGREGEACRKEGCSGTVERIVQSNRSTFFCPKCQK